MTRLYYAEAWNCQKINKAKKISTVFCKISWLDSTPGLFRAWSHATGSRLFINLFVSSEDSLIF